MGDEVIIYDHIDGAPWRTTDDEYRRLQNKNAVVFYQQLPMTDTWPWLTRGMFALPAPWPQGTFRQQVIHFGASFKDDGFDPQVWPYWIEKFEALLRRLYWSSAVVHIEHDRGPTRTWRWTPTAAALDRLRANDPPPIREWTRADPG